MLLGVYREGFWCLQVVERILVRKSGKFCELSQIHCAKGKFCLDIAAFGAVLRCLHRVQFLDYLPAPQLAEA